MSVYVKYKLYTVYQYYIIIWHSAIHSNNISIGVSGDAYFKPELLFYYLFNRELVVLKEEMGRSHRSLS